MRRLLAVALIFALPPAAMAEDYRDTPTAEWFRSLSSVFEGSCCDQADCHTARSDYRDGAWWAVSNRTGQWVRIVPVQLTFTLSIFKDGVLCEGDPITAAGGAIARIYCFAPPPFGF